SWSTPDAHNLLEILLEILTHQITFVCYNISTRQHHCVLLLMVLGNIENGIREDSAQTSKTHDALHHDFHR
ncbi:MAG: hypothetical protein P8Y28_00645, partial [Gammaproteobacteria bacterium]